LTKKLTRYQKRKRAGQRDRAKFEKYRVHYHHLEVLFSGLTLCGVFLVVMGFVRGYETPTDFIVAYLLTALSGVMLTIREYFRIKSSWWWWKKVVN
jgi:hypothetical protein